MIYKLDNVNINSFGATAVLSGEKIAISGIFDCPKRKTPTERSWDTEIEPFVDALDIQFEGRDLSVSFIMLKSGNLAAFKQAIIDCTTLSVDALEFSVICKSEVVVTEIGEYYQLAVKFWQETVNIPELTTIAINTGSIKIDNFNLHDNFGIHGNVVGGFRSVGPRIEVNTTEPYTHTAYREFRELSINCFMVGSSFSDLYSKMTQFQALLYAQGMRTLVVDNNSYSCYCKSGFKAQVVADNLIKFTLKLHTND
jgi:hypothetical protein